MRALLVTAMFGAIPTMYPDPARVKQIPRGGAKPRVSRGRGLGSGSMVNESEPTINLVNWQHAKDADRHEPKWCVGRPLDCPFSEQGQQVPPGNSRHLTFQLSPTRNTVSPYSRPSGQSEPQGTPMGVRVQEAGKSECLAVMAGIGVADSSNITPPERAQTSGWSLLAREFVEPS